MPECTCKPKEKIISAGCPFHGVKSSYGEQELTAHDLLSSISLSGFSRSGFNLKNREGRRTMDNVPVSFEHARDFINKMTK